MAVIRSRERVFGHLSGRGYHEGLSILYGDDTFEFTEANQIVASKANRLASLS